MTHIPQRLVAVDLMDTLIHDPWQEALEAATGLRCDEINRRRDIAVWHQFEAGLIDEAAYWRHFNERGIKTDAAVFHRIRRQNYRWLPGARAMLDALQAGPHPVVIASNYPVWMDDVTATLLADHHIPLYVSWRLGVRKPEAAFFERMARDFGLSPSAVLLIDDSASNVAAITALGGRGILHTTAVNTTKLLKSQEIS